MARKIEGTVYRVSFYGCSNCYFIECDSLDDLYDYVARKVANGGICSSVAEIRIDGSTPRVPVLTTKRYKELLKHYQTTVHSSYNF